MPQNYVVVNQLIRLCPIAFPFFAFLLGQNVVNDVLAGTKIRRVLVVESYTRVWFSS